MNENELDAVVQAYIGLHAMIPATKPGHETAVLDEDGRYYLKSDYSSSITFVGSEIYSEIYRFRCAALTWAGLAVGREVNHFLGEAPDAGIEACESMLSFWVLDGASNDLYLIDICKRIYEAGGKP